MEEGSFEPMDLPHLSLSAPREMSWSDRSDGYSSKGEDEESRQEGDSAASPDVPPPMPESMRLASRFEVEEECGLPELRAAAVASEEAVEDAANSLLSVLHNLDTAKRSARLAAESCLVGACNAQADCLRSVIGIERANLKERLQLLDELENVAKDMDVRADIDHYISTDKMEVGGQSLLGDDDDGGVASALAVINSHLDEDRRPSRSTRSHNEEDGQDAEAEDDSSISREYLEEAVSFLFRKNPLLFGEAPNVGKKKTSLDELEATITKLCNIGEDRSPKARSLRSTICYTLNSKRSSHTQIPSSAQFEGLCRIFSALLFGCDCTDSSGVSNAKMLMGLSFVYHLKKPGDEDGESKIYVKSRLLDHPFWGKDEFWDQALIQTVGEFLSQSGALSNFERASSRIVTATAKKRSEYTDSQAMQWHDLKEEERYEAASQVHAVVFAQLGTMIDSMLDFGIGLERTSAFVRRMSVRNQLPMSQRTTLLRHLIAREGEKDKVALR